MIKIKVEKKHENAVLPSKKYDKDYCYDVTAISEEEIAPNVWKYGIGLGFQIDREASTIDLVDHPDYIPSYIALNVCPAILSIDLRPRSSVWETGMILSNCEGTIDEPFTGEVSAVFYHVMPNMPRYKVGDRIGQIKVGFTQPIEFEIVDELNNTDRGNGGYGSTGR